MEAFQEFDFQLQYHKGRYNLVADTLSRIPMANLLSFTELKSELLDSLRGKCTHDLVYAAVWNIALR